ncbi:RNA helicase [Handroanthus impetiginosus]|uniref:RNA helicase n=1 Tax=Handroanthus impetiginosus TaxID=429701 RepID=A0A2G9H711_9LAMI|nr:RNA helicase [Handroanthus impetiginosus]
MEEPKGKSRREGSEKEEAKNSRREDRNREKERNGERHRDRDRDSHHEREKSVDDKYREREKHKSKRREKEGEQERTRSRDDERVRDKAKGREKDRDDREFDRDREDREREKDRDREKERTRDRDRARERDREKDRGREKEREREKDRERDKEREREKDRERERYGEREREREREKERRDRDRERERERKEKKEREKRRDMDRSYSSDEDIREHERKRRRRDDDHQNRDVEQSSKTHRHRDGSQDSNLRKKGDGDSEFGTEKTREEDLAEEQKRLDEEMEKRRRRVQEWQELRRKKEESEKEKLGPPATHESNSGKTWTLEGESDDEEAGPDGKVTMDVDEDGAVKPIGEDGTGMLIDSENGPIPASQNGGDHAIEDDEIDPLDAFMNSMVLPEVEKLNNSVPPVPNDSGLELVERNGNPSLELSKKASKSMGRIIPGENSDSDYEDMENDEDPLEDEDDEEFMKRVKKTKVEKLSIVDHSKIDYPPFRKNFYIEVKESSRMTSEEVAAYRKQLELKIHGKDVPKPVKTWHQTGLSTKILDTIKKLNYEKPMPIQAQALPVIMSGRDCIGIAKTGSGKTLAFVLPMLRHIKDQPPLMSGDGPIGLIMAPTRELVQQIHSDIKKFAKVMGLSCVPVYGGSGVAQQISELKRGAEIVVCTPGRMIDILCTSGGKITNLRRVTYLVLDEADRMFDMGFEPQITRIVQNTRPDRQTVLFSATFPRQVEILARKVLNKPVEIQVGGRSVVNKDITQLVEVRPESDRFLRLLEILGEWYEKGKILIFVHTQEKCDALFKDLLRSGYPCLSLHGAKDQTDRESTIADFKSNVCNLLIATSVAARGLDVKELELVINFDAPNHYEDYVHRVGRTGRAGRKGCAITFVSEEDARYAPDLVKALELSEQSVPDDLRALADGFMAKVNQGLEQAHGTGYGGSGFKFNEEEDEVRRAAKKAQAKEYGFEEDKSDSEDEDEGIRKAGGEISHQAVLSQAAALAAASKVSAASVSTPLSAAQLTSNGGLPVSLPSVLGLTIPGVPAVAPGTGLPVSGNDGAARAAADRRRYLNVVLNRF